MANIPLNDLIRQKDDRLIDEAIDIVFQVKSVQIWNEALSKDRAFLRLAELAEKWIANLRDRNNLFSQGE